MRPGHFSGLTARMLLFAAAALLPVLLLMAYMEWRNAGERLAQERTRAAHLAELVAREQALPFALGRQKLRDLALLREIAAPGDRRACSEALLRAARDSPYLRGIALFAADGEAICASAAPLPPPAAARDYFQEALHTGRMTVSDYLASSRDGAGVVAMALPLAAAQGGERFVLRAGLDLAWMAGALAEVPAAPGTNIVVVDSRGVVLAPQRWAGQSVAEHAVFRHVSGITSATGFEAVGIDGVERIFVARPLNQAMGGGAYLWVAVPKSSATEAALRDFLGITALVFVTVLVLFAVIWREGSRMVLRPVRRLREAAQRLAGSQLSARTNLPHSDDEIGRLAATFDEMAGKIETRERELERSRASLLRANRALRVLAAAKDVTGSAEAEEALLDELCRTVARVSGYALCYIARADFAPDKPLAIVAQAGLPGECRDGLALSWADNERGRGAAGSAVREGRPCVFHGVRTSPNFAPWRDIAAKMGLEAVIGLPLRVDGRVWGVLVLASTWDDVFDGEEVRLLEELAGEVGRGIEMQRLRAEKQAAEAALLEMMGGLERRVAERTAELEQANRELEAFSYSLSHDLRAPLRAIDGFAHALDEECGRSLKAECRDFLVRIRNSAHRMSGLIEDMLRLGRISNQEMHAAEVDLSSLAGEIGRELAAAEPGRAVRLAVAPGLAARGDPGLLHALLRNLMENAWKYTAHSSQPAVEFGRDADGAFFVRDNGAGFDMVFADRLFRPFSRLHRADEYPGTGIGLATVARIVSRHGGRAWAEAEKGRGATFFFRLR